MPSIESKKRGNTTYSYLIVQVRVANMYKKLQVYLGKHIPKDLSPYYERLKRKELTLFADLVREQVVYGARIDVATARNIESTRIRYKYLQVRQGERERERFWWAFATRFIFESNAIEGSRLSQQEVARIVRGGYIPKALDRREVREVENAIRAFAHVRESNFRINQRSVKELHAMLTEGLHIPSGYKRHAIVVNNTHTTPPEKVRQEMTALLAWWRAEMHTTQQPFFTAVKFHQRFEKIHPFEDGNGRVGRLLLNWMLFEAGYGPILILARSRRGYFAALKAADEGRATKLFHMMASTYKRTLRVLDTT